MKRHEFDSFNPTIMPGRIECATCGELRDHELHTGVKTLLEIDVRNCVEILIRPGVITTTEYHLDADGNRVLTEDGTRLIYKVTTHPVAQFTHLVINDDGQRHVYDVVKADCEHNWQQAINSEDGQPARFRRCHLCGLEQKRVPGTCEWVSATGDMDCPERFCLRGEGHIGDHNDGNGRTWP